MVNECVIRPSLLYLKSSDQFKQFIGLLVRPSCYVYEPTARFFGGFVRPPVQRISKNLFPEAIAYPPVPRRVLLDLHEHSSFRAEAANLICEGAQLLLFCAKLSALRFR